MVDKNKLGRNSFFQFIDGRYSRILVLILTMCFINLKVAYSQSSSITLNIENKPIKEVLTEIEKASNYLFFYQDNALSKNQNVSIHVTNQAIEKVLDQLFKDTDNSYKISDRQIFISSNKENKTSTGEEKRKITGTVYDKDMKAFPGVSVVLKNQTIGTTTDLDGHYFIEVPNKESVLSFSFIGYKDQDVVVGNRVNVDIELKEVVNDLDEVVVVGFGSQRKLSVVGSITSIEPTKLQEGTTRSLSNNLGGRLSGVIAVQRSGEPGYDNSDFWIRGISTFGGNRRPLILIDGVERSLNDLDPEEIASFSILKDASASAVYGVRGANGVILINTKRGEIGKPKVSVRFEQSVTEPVRLPDFVGAADYLEILNKIREEAGKDGLFSPERIANIRNQTDPDLYPDVNWLNAISKDYASNTRTNLNISGGNNVLRYVLIASHYGESGILARDKSQEWNSSMTLNRYNVRSNVDIDVTSTTLVRLNIGGYIQNRNKPPQSIDDLFQEAFSIPPYVHPTRYSSGEIPRTPERTNPWALATQQGYERNYSNKIESLFSIEQDLKFLLSGLKVRGLFSFDSYSDNWVKRSKSPDYYNPATGRDKDGNLELVIASYGQEFLGHEKGSGWGNRSMYVEGNISYTQNFGKHYLDIMTMYNQRNYDDGDKLPYRNQGIAGRFSYSFARKYIGEFNFGYNGSENFARGKRFGFFPSVAVGWLLSEESFMEALKQDLSKIKFRFSYGQAGNDRIDGRRFPYITTIGDTDGYKWGVDNNFNRSGRREGDYGNPDLTWETVTKANLGIELGLWNAIDLQVDFFKENRKNIFMQRKTIPGSSGFINTPWANYGKVENKGIDISLNINKQLSEKLFVSFLGTFTYAANKIIEQDEAITVIGTNRSGTGKPIGQLFGLEHERLFTNDDFENIETGTLKSDIPNHTYGPVRPGDIKYRDINGDKVINDLDRTAIGRTEDPQIVYGFGTTVKYLNVDFSFFFQGLANTNRIIGGNNFIPGSGAGALGNIYSNADDRWTLENPRQDVFYPRLSETKSANNTEASTWWLKDMSFLRMKNIEIGYQFSRKLIQKIGLHNVRVFTRGSNLLTFSRFKLWDPEIGVNNGLKYPIMKSVSFGVEVNF